MSNTRLVDIIINTLNDESMEDKREIAVTCTGLSLDVETLDLDDMLREVF